MEDNSLNDLVSQLIPDEFEKALGVDDEETGEQNQVYVESLRAAAAKSGGPVKAAVNEFLNGEGDLFEATRAATTHSEASAESEVATFLTTKLKLSPFAAKLIAMLAVKLFPSIGKLTGSGTTAKKKTRRKKKAKTSSSAKTTASSKKKPKKKTTTQLKKKTSKSAAKKKPSSTSSKKDSAARKKTKKKTRSASLDVSTENP